MKIKRAAAVLGTLAVSSGLVVAFGPLAPQAGAGIPPDGILVGDAVTVVEGDAGLLTMTFEITRSGPIGACRVTVATVNDTATGGSDYVSFAQLITIPAGDDLDPPVLVDITLTPDQVYEPDALAGTPDYETVRLTATPYFGGVVDPPACTVVDGDGIGAIEDDDAPGALSIAMLPDYAECESAMHATHPGHALWSEGYVRTSFKLNRNLGDGEEVTLDLVSQNGTALDPADYSGIISSFTITGPTSELVDDNGTPADTSDDTVLFEASIAIVDDFTPELDDHFKVLMQNVTYTGPEQHFIVDTEQIIIIRNDDVIGNEIYVSNPSHVEGDPGDDNYLTFTLSSKYPAICDGINLHWVTSNGTAGDGVDYSGGAGYAVIPPGQTYVQVQIPIIEDLLIEDNETMYLTVDEPLGVVGDTQGVGTILDDDYPWVDVSNATVVEGTGGTNYIVFTIALSGTVDSPTFVPHRALTVWYSTSNGTATAPSDYTAVSSSVSFSPTDTSKTVSIPVVTDSTPENNETMHLNLTSADYANIDYNDADLDGRDEQGDGTIWNDDDWIVNGIDISTLEGTPPDPNHAVIVTLQLNAPAPTQGFTVDWDLQDGTANAPLDYIDANGTAVFASGFSSATVPPVIVTDDFIEFDETFIVNLSNPQVIVSPGGCVGGCFRLLLGADAVVTIVNDDVELPATGSNGTPFTITGLGLLGAGFALMFGTRRRRATAA